MASNIFDGLRDTAFDVVARAMGYDAYWHPGGSPVDEPVKARVLFNRPGKEEQVANHDYTFGRPSLEYRGGDWPGLYEEAGQSKLALVEVEGQYYYVYKVSLQDGYGYSKDGNTYVAILDKANDP
ncbi:MAG: hypothetical protein QM642_01860 [Edaphocola sp.]